MKITPIVEAGKMQPAIDLYHKEGVKLDSVYYVGEDYKEAQLWTTFYKEHFFLRSCPALRGNEEFLDGANLCVVDEKITPASVACALNTDAIFPDYRGLMRVILFGIPHVFWRRFEHPPTSRSSPMQGFNYIDDTIKAVSCLIQEDVGLQTLAVEATSLWELVELRASGANHFLLELKLVYDIFS